MEKIRAFQKADTDRVMQLWLEGNLDAHGFIPRAYWTSHYEMVREQLAQAELFVYESEGELLGFVGVMDGYIAGIFIDREYRSQGIGTQLLDCLKARFPALTLGVYQKNRAAAAFYLREGFVIDETGLDEDTGELDYTMSWHRDKL